MVLSAGIPVRDTRFRNQVPDKPSFHRFLKGFPDILSLVGERPDRECFVLPAAINMSQQQVAQLVSRLLGSVAKYSVVAGVGVTALQSSLYTGDQFWLKNDAQLDC